MARHIELEGLPEERVAAIAVRLINLGWFRVGTDRYAKSSRTFGITTLRKSHVAVRGSRISFTYRGKHSIMLRGAIVDAELAAVMRELMAQRISARSSPPRTSAREAGRCSRQSSLQTMPHPRRKPKRNGGSPP